MNRKTTTENDMVLYWKVLCQYAIFTMCIGFLPNTFTKCILKCLLAKSSYFVSIRINPPDNTTVRLSIVRISYRIVFQLCRTASESHLFHWQKKIENISHFNETFSHHFQFYKWTPLVINNYFLVLLSFTSTMPFETFVRVVFTRKMVINFLYCCLMRLILFLFFLAFCVSILEHFVVFICETHNSAYWIYWQAKSILYWMREWESLSLQFVSAHSHISHFLFMA